MPRRSWLGTLAVLLFLVAAALSLHLVAARPRWRINREACAKIQPGMSREEVIALLGLLPGDYTVFRHTRYGGPWLMGYWVAPSMESWASDAGTIYVVFDSGEVRFTEFYDGKEGWRRPWAEAAWRLLGWRD